MRYLILLALNVPVIALAAVNILTQYKMHRISSARFRHQILLWATILAILVASFPFYNWINNRPVFDSSELSLFDIAQTTVLIFMIYAVNHQRQSIDRINTMTRDLHQEISILLAEQNNKK